MQTNCRTIYVSPNPLNLRFPVKKVKRTKVACEHNQRQKHQLSKDNNFLKNHE